MDQERKIADMSMDAIRDNPWSAVHLAMPMSPTNELVRSAHQAAQYCYFGARARAEDPNGRWRSSSEPPIGSYDTHGDATQQAEAAAARVRELELQWPALERMHGAPFQISHSV
jgi:hypothetical protein